MKPAIAAAALLLTGLPLARAEAPAPVANQLSLSASAVAEVAQDTMQIVFAVRREGPDAASVQAQLMQALEPALTEARKAARPGQIDIASGNFTVFPRHAPNGGIASWQGSAEMRAEGRDIVGLTKLVPRIQTMNVSRVGWSLSREAREKVQSDVAAQAIARFRSQAETYAKGFGFGAVTLGAVQVDTNESSPGPQPVFRASRAAMADDAALPAEAGKAQVMVTVSGSVQMK